MASTLLFVSLLAAISGVAQAAYPQYNIEYPSKFNGDFCHEWRGFSVEYAGSQCHHHVISCKDLGHGKAVVYSGWIPFNNHAPGVCDPASGFDWGIAPTDDTTTVAKLAGVTIIKPHSQSKPAKKEGKKPKRMVKDA